MRKACPSCRTERPIEDFHRHAARPDGRQRLCKACQCAAVCASYARRHADTPYTPDPWAISTSPPLAALFAEFDSRRRRA